MINKYIKDMNLYQKIIESSEEGIWLIDVKGATIFVNKKMGRILGYETEEMLGKTMYEFMGKDEIALAQTNLKRREGGESEHHDFLFRKKDGSKVWTSVSASPFYDGNSEYAGALGIVTDITKRRNTEVMLQAQRTILEALVVGKSLEFALTQLIDGIEELIDGVKCSVLLLDEEGKRLWKGAAPSLPAEYNNAIHGALIGPNEGSCGTSAYTKKVVIVSDIQTDPLWKNYKEIAGKFNLSACWSSPILNENGEVLGTFALYFTSKRSPSAVELDIVKDATAAASVAIDFVRKRENERLLKHKTTFLAESRKILGSSLDLNFLRERIPQMAVPFLADHCFLGLSEDSDLPDVLIESIKTGEAHHGERDCLGRKDISSCLCLPMTVRGKTIGGLVLSNKVTESTHREIDLALATEFSFSCGIAIDNATLYEEAKQSLILRDEFLSVASHELRTPLTVLRGRIDLILMMVKKGLIPSEIGEKIVPNLSSSHSQVNQLSKLVDNLLDLKKLGENKLVLNREEIVLSELLKEQVSNFSTQLQQKSCTVIYDLDESIKGFWDRSRLEQVFTNLISNSIKFGPGPRLEITSYKDQDLAVIKFRDFGMGIPEKDQKRIFQRFERAVSGKYFSGLGLGLFITHQIIATHNGEIQVQSEENKGATFIIKLPILRPS